MLQTDHIIMKANVTALNSLNQHQFTKHLSTTFTQYDYEFFTIKKRRICFGCSNDADILFCSFNNVYVTSFMNQIRLVCVWSEFFSTVIHFPRTLCIPAWYRSVCVIFIYKFTNRISIFLSRKMLRTNDP